MTTKTDKTENKADELPRSEYDHKEGRLSEPKVGDEPTVLRHQVDPVMDPKQFEDEGNGVVPRRADPFAHQRDEKAAKAAHKEEVAKGEKESDPTDKPKGDKPKA